jgi:hypothetical protein
MAHSESETSMGKSIACLKHPGPSLFTAYSMDTSEVGKMAN